MISREVNTERGEVLLPVGNGLRLVPEFEKIVAAEAAAGCGIVEIVRRWAEGELPLASFAGVVHALADTELSVEQVGSDIVACGVNNQKITDALAILFTNIMSGGEEEKSRKKK